MSENQPIKRFLMFAFDRYYPGGGEADAAWSFDTMDEAEMHASTLDADYIEVLDMVERQWIDIKPRYNAGSAL